MASMSANFVTSPVTNMAWPPRLVMSAWTFTKASVSRPWRTTFAPCLANAIAISAPMPRELPVTRTTLPFRSAIFRPCSLRPRPGSPPMTLKITFGLPLVITDAPVAR